MYTCPICGNSDEKYIAFKNNKPYCRRCITFKGNKAKETFINPTNYQVQLKYPLSPAQNEISLKVIDGFKNHKNVLINAVCGAGKTELVYGVISYALRNSMQIGFCIPRRDVVVDLLPRLKEAFPFKKVIAVYGGNTSSLEGDIILLTTHQLYRYENYFDLLIIDETDAFPYQGNFVLNQMFNRALRGNYVMLSATPLESMINAIKECDGVYLTLYKRYHGHPLPVPEIKICLFHMHLGLYLEVKKFYKQNLPMLIFTPTIEECEKIYKFIHMFFKKGFLVHSKREDRNIIIDDFKNNKYLYLVTTSVLERGVTIKNLQVIVYMANHALYDEKTLIQISGRVGRKIDAPDGKVIYISEYKTESMVSSIRKIENANK